MHDLKFFDFDRIDKIYLIKKRSYGAKIYLDEPINQEWFIILLQCLLGSDYMKEVNTCINHFKLNMDYSNRLFDIKRYRSGKIKKSSKMDVTNDIKEYIYSSDRIKYNN